ncbi:hypothetical protein D6810_01970 [Candidatus Dojkabacteria bacterium]|uniref:Uncharacterized protein n=1 Tax=Candidatus Dojkabacteria bacterium TaxID=2099670 RepID=A0A3M0YYB1_9BACT|nr:MAG: hypothetical protein D6810_01970 [Candidatus Dojkabacteria bacterium]
MTHTYDFNHFVVDNKHYLALS